jgi:hypothetical protein
MGLTRQSADILAIPDARIALALRFIWQNFAQPIPTPEVAAASWNATSGSTCTAV